MLGRKERTSIRAKLHFVFDIIIEATKRNNGFSIKLYDPDDEWW